MNKNIKLLAIGLAAFILGVGVNNFAMSNVASGKIAVLDINKVAQSSSQVQALKKDNQAKGEELLKYIDKAKKDIESVTDPGKKKALEEKYSKEFSNKRQSYENDYKNKLQDIDKNITNAITEYAKGNGYDIVLAKGIVLYGGTDITDAIIKTVK